MTLYQIILTYLALGFILHLAKIIWERRAFAAAQEAMMTYLEIEGFETEVAVKHEMNYQQTSTMYQRFMPVVVVADKLLFFCLYGVLIPIYFVTFFASVVRGYKFSAEQRRKQAHLN